MRRSSVEMQVYSGGQWRQKRSLLEFSLGEDEEGRMETQWVALRGGVSVLRGGGGVGR